MISAARVKGMELPNDIEIRQRSIVYVPMTRRSASILRPDYSNWHVDRLAVTRLCNQLNEKYRGRPVWTVGVYCAYQIPREHRPQSTWDW